MNATTVNFYTEMSNSIHLPGRSRRKANFLVVYAGRKCRMLYASQISPSLGGRRISVEEVPLSILNDSAVTKQLFSFRDGVTPEFIFMTGRMGNKL